MAACQSRPIRAEAIETFVIDRIRCIGADPELQRETFRQALAQVAARKRGVAVERKRIERDLALVKADVARWVGTLSRTTAPAADAVRTELEAAQERVRTIEGRQREIQTQDVVPTVTEAEVAPLFCNQSRRRMSTARMADAWRKW